MTKISADIETDYREASAAGRRAIIEKLQRYIDRGLWAQSIMQALAAHDTSQAQQSTTAAVEPVSASEQTPAATGKP